MNTITVPSVDVLRNRGIQIEVHVVDVDEHGKYSRRFDDNDQPVYEAVWVKFDNWAIANIEQPAPAGFGDLDGWEQELNIRATSTVLKSFALIEDKYVLNAAGQTLPDMRWAAMRLKDNSTRLYALALANAMFMANGIEADVVGEVLRRSLKVTIEALEDGNAKAAASLAELEDSITQTDRNPLPESPSGTPTGADSVEALTSSGA
jgi:hypothetical protein